MGELKVQNVTQCHALKRQNLTNLTRTSCACVRGGKNEVKITCTHAPGEMIKQYSFIDTNRTQSDTLNNRKTTVAGNCANVVSYDRGGRYLVRWWAFMEVGK